jgi:hypothetical protein
MNHDKLKQANELAARIEAHERTISELKRCSENGRIVEINRPHHDSPIRIETSGSVYEICNIGDDNFADLVWSKIIAEIRRSIDTLKTDLDELTAEFESM